jgi:lysosomal Pro-X carboxypeptidase
MLASWMRQKYPGAVAGAVAASAPVLAFPGMSPSFDSESYWATVTRTAERSAPGCANAVRTGFAALRAVSLAHVQDAVGACQPVTSEAERERWAVFLAVAWDTMAMGSYPYPTNYMTGGGDNPPLPAWPVRAACEAMMTEDVRAGPTGALGRLTKASGVFNNATGTVGECYELPSDDEYDGIWDYQWCTELMPQETYFAMNGVSDMFWPRSDSGASVRNRCERRFGILPRRRWIAASTGGGPRGLAAVTRVVYSNGELDPWSSGGVRSSLGPETVAVDIPEGGHHADLFFAHPEDPPSLIAARVTTMALVRDWIVQFRREAALATGAPTSAIATE